MTGLVQVISGPLLEVEEQPMKRRKIDSTKRAEVYDSRGPGIRIDEKRRDPDLLELQVVEISLIKCVSDSLFSTTGFRQVFHRRANES